MCRNQLSAADTAESLAEYQALRGEMDQEMDRVRLALQGGMEPAYFDGRLTGIRKALVRALGTVGARPYLIYSDKKRPLSRYALRLELGQICFSSIDN